MDSLQRLLERLETAKGDTQMQAALAAEFSLQRYPENERTRLFSTLDAATVLHNFNAELLSRLLTVDMSDASERLAALRNFLFVETYRKGDRESFNLHEAVRLGRRRRLTQHFSNRFRELSLRASRIFADDMTPAGRIEWIYHLLCGSPEQGASELEKLNRDWISQSRPEHYFALATTLQELETTQLVGGRARLWCLLVIASARDKRGETAQLLEAGRQCLTLARELQDAPAEVEAHWLMGISLKSHGDLKKALAAFEETLAINQRLAVQDPNNTGWQRELAVAYGRIGHVLQSQGRLDVAQAAFEEFLAISQRLAAHDPSDAGWQRDLASAYICVGDVLQAQGRLDAALAAFEETLAISQRLAAHDPSNSLWQRELAVAYSCVGDIFQSQGRLDSAQTAFKESLAISQRLLAHDPTNAVWQRGLAVAHVCVGIILENQGRLFEAQASFEEALPIFQQLSTQDPNNAVWQQDLKNAQDWLKQIHSKLNPK